MATKFHRYISLHFWKPNPNERSISVHLPPIEPVNSQRTPVQPNPIVEDNIGAPSDPPDGSSRTMSHRSLNSVNGTGAPAGNAKDHCMPSSQGSDKTANRIHTQGSGTQPEVMAMLGRMVSTISDNLFVVLQLTLSGSITESERRYSRYSDPQQTFHKQSRGKYNGLSDPKTSSTNHWSQALQRLCL